VVTYGDDSVRPPESVSGAERRAGTTPRDTIRNLATVGGGILRVGCQNMWVFNTLRPQKYTHLNIARIWGTLGIAQIDIGGGSAPLDHPQGPLRGTG